MSRPAWVAIACIAGFALYELVSAPPESDTIEFPYQARPLLIRMTDRQIAFPVLGAHVTLGSGWAYLSTTNPALSDRPTFVNAEAQAIVTLMPASSRAEEWMESVPSALRTERASPGLERSRW